MKRYKVSKYLLRQVEKVLSLSFYTGVVEYEENQLYIRTNASSDAFHRIVIRALCEEISEKTGLEHVSDKEVENYLYFKNLVEEKGVCAYAIATKGSSDRSKYVIPDDGFEEVALDAIKASMDVTGNASAIRSKVSEKQLRDEAKALQVSKIFPGIAGDFVIENERVLRLIGNALHKELSSVSKWLYNSEIGDKMVVYRDLRVDVGECFVSGTFMSHMFPLTGLTVIIEKIGSASFKIVSAYPCIAGNDEVPIREEMDEWRKRNSGE